MSGLPPIFGVCVWLVLLYFHVPRYIYTLSFCFTRFSSKLWMFTDIFLKGTRKCDCLIHILSLRYKQTPVKITSSIHRILFRVFIEIETSSFTITLLEDYNKTTKNSLSYSRNNIPTLLHFKSLQLLIASCIVLELLTDPPQWYSCIYPQKSELYNLYLLIIVIVLENVSSPLSRDMFYVLVIIVIKHRKFPEALFNIDRSV